MFIRRCTPGIPGYLPEYDQNNQLWYSSMTKTTRCSTPSITKTTKFGTRVPMSIYLRVYTLGIPGYLPEYDQNNQVWYTGTSVYT